MAQEDESVDQAVRLALSETSRRGRGAFDGLLGLLPPDTSRVLQDIVSDLRDHLLERYEETEVRQLLAQHEPHIGFSWITSVPDDVELALRLLNNVWSAAACDVDRFAELILGKAGARDRPLQAGRKKAGQRTGEKRTGEAKAKYEKWRREAAALLATGKPLHNVAGILAERHGVSSGTIRRGLKKTGAG